MGIVDGRGKINGSVASKNRAGAYVRTKVSPVNPNTTYQAGARSLLAGLSANWRELTQAQRDAWNAAVSDFQRTDVFGDLRKPTGKNLYTRLNINLSNIGQPWISVPPAAVNLAPAVISGVTISVGTPTYEIAYTPGTAGSTMLLFATAPQSAGKNFVKSEFRLIGSFAADAASPYDFEADYTTRFGVPTVGEKVFVRVMAINDATGISSAPQELYTIVAS